MRGSICQAKLASAFDKIEDLVRNFSTSASESWSLLMTLGFDEKSGSLIIA